MGGNNIIHSTAGVELVRKLAEKGERVFTVDRARKMAASIGISPIYLDQALHHLSRSNWIVRLRKGLYALSSSVPGALPLHEFEVAMALVHPAAISHWSALNHHALTEQTPQKIFVSTTAKSVPHLRNKRKDRKVGYPVAGTLYQFIQTKLERFFGIQDIWVNESRIKMTDPERTLLDGLMSPDYCGDFSEVLHAFEMGRDKLDLQKIISYALKLDGATARRLGWVLEHQGVGARKLEPLRRIPIKGFRILDPTGPHQGSYDSSWMIQVNLPGKLES